MTNCYLDPEPTDSELLAVPGGAYAVLRRLRERLRDADLPPPPLPPPPLPAPPPSVDPWARPDWDVDTVYLPLLLAPAA